MKRRTILLLLLVASRAAAQCPEAEKRLDVGDPAGASDSSEPVLAIGPDNGLHVAWTDERAPNGDIYYSGSLDGGNSWTDPIPRLNVGEAPGATGAWSPTVTAGPAGVIVVGWVDDRNSIGIVRNDLMVNASGDNGATWEAADIRVNTPPPPDIPPPEWAVSEPRLMADAGGNVHAVWVENRASSRKLIRYSRSADGGLSWLGADIQIDEGDPNQQGDARTPRVAEGPGVLHVVWRATRNNEEGIWYARSTDGGDNWEANRQLSTATGLSAAQVGAPDLHVEGDRIIVVWNDRRFGRDDVFAVSSADGGASWTPDEVRLDGDPEGDATSRFPLIAGNGGGVHIAAWLDSRNGARDVLLSRSTDGGSSWSPNPLRLDVGSLPGADQSECLALAMNGAIGGAVWREDREVPEGLYFNRSTDAGAGWSSFDARVDGGFPDDASSCNGPVLTVDSAGMSHIVWADLRDGAPDIYYARCGELIDVLDCDPADPDTWRSPADFDEPVLMVRRVPGAPARVALSWTDLGPMVGPAVVYDVAAGSLDDLAQSGDFGDAGCPCEDIPVAGVDEQGCPGLAGGRMWYLVRGQNSCGVSTFGTGTFPAGQDPREALDAPAGPCTP